MCTMIMETTPVLGSATGPKGWFKLKRANVSFDHPFNAPLDHALNIDFVNEELSLAERVTVELSPDSARQLVAAIETALNRGELEMKPITSF